MFFEAQSQQAEETTSSPLCLLNETDFSFGGPVLGPSCTTSLMICPQVHGS